MTRSLAIAWLLAVLLAALLAPWLTPHNPRQPVAEPLEPPQAGLPLGSDALGRDLWARTVYGARITLTAAFSGTALAVVLGSVVGLLAAVLGGWTDRGITAGVNATLSIPGLILAMLLVAALGPGLGAVVLAFGLGAAPGFARLSRAAFLQVRSRGYVLASTAIGAGTGWVALRHVVPNAWRSMASLAGTYFAWAMLGITTLTFLGLAGDPSMPEWGAMLNAGRAHLIEAPRLCLIPGAAITLTVLAVQQMVEGDAGSTRP